MDGSSYEFAKKLLEIGLQFQKKPKKVLKILRKVSIKDGAKSIKVLPSSYSSFSIKINFSYNLIGFKRYWKTES